METLNVVIYGFVGFLCLLVIFLVLYFCIFMVQETIELCSESERKRNQSHQEVNQGSEVEKGGFEIANFKIASRQFEIPPQRPNLKLRFYDEYQLSSRISLSDKGSSSNSSSNRSESPLIKQVLFFYRERCNERDYEIWGKFTV